jgi:hypothetical protein
VRYAAQLCKSYSLSNNDAQTWPKDDRPDPELVNGRHEDIKSRGLKIFFCQMFFSGCGVYRLDDDWKNTDQSRTIADPRAFEVEKVECHVIIAQVQPS